MKLIQVNNLYDRQGRKRKLAIRFSILSLGAFFIAQVIPTLADEHAKVIEVSAQISASPSASPTDSPVADPSGTALPVDGTSASPSPSPVPVQLLESQDIGLKFPNQVEVDPRALVVKLPQVNFTGPEYLLVCAVADGAILDVIGKGSLDDQAATNLYLDGDLTSRFVMSGPTTLVSSAFNSFGGLKISGLGTKLISTRVHFSFIAVDGIAQNSSLCGSVKAANSRMLTFKALGVGLGLKKGEVKL